MSRFTRRQRLRYWFDTTLASGPIALVGWLFLASACLTVGIVAIIAATGVGTDANGHKLAFGPAGWIGLLSTLDTGEIENNTGNQLYLGGLLLITLNGIFLASTLIGLLTNAINDRLEALRQGHSLVVEEGHTVILGWSPHIFALVAELVAANSNRRSAAIAILAEQDSVAMETAIRARVGKTGHTRIVCRTGSPIDLTDLAIVNPRDARAIVIPAPDMPDPDSFVIKAILAITRSPHRRPEPYHIVAEIQNARNLEVARLVGREEAQLLVADEVVARIAAQTCRQSGLSAVYTELLDFAGDEIYIRLEPSLAGKTFGEALLAYEDSTLIGLRLASGTVTLNPPMDTAIGSGDAVVVIATDDDTIRLAPAPPHIDSTAIREADPPVQAPERTLILGWNRGAALIINELDNYVASGSVVTVVADTAEAEEEIGRRCSGLANQSVSFQLGDTTDRSVLDQLAVPSYDHVITLSYTDTLDLQAADSRTLITLIYLRDIVQAMDQPISIVSEMLDARNRQLAEVTRADDFIVSDSLVSLLLSQIAENRDLNAVFGDLFDAAGSELYLKPAGQYVALDRPMSFATVVAAARTRGEVAIGYRLRAEATGEGPSYGVHLNPAKSRMIALGEADRVIVLAEN